LHEQLLSLGFSPCAASLMRMSHSQTPFAIYVRAGSDITATLMCSNSGIASAITLEYALCDDQGNHLSLINSRFAGIFPRWERKTVFRRPSIRDAGGL